MNLPFRVRFGPRTQGRGAGQVLPSQNTGIFTGATIQPVDRPLERLRERIASLTEEALTTSQLFARADQLIRRAIPCDGSVWATVDPATGLFTSCERFELNEVPDLEWLVYDSEFSGVDYVPFRTLAQGPRYARALALETDGAPQQSQRFRALSAFVTVADELRLALVSRGRWWGTATLYRRDRQFSQPEEEFAHAVAADLGEAVRLAMVRVLAEAGAPIEQGPGVVVLGPTGAIDSMTGAAASLLSRLDPGRDVPPVVAAVALAGSRRDAQGAHARVADASGGWIELHGAPLSGDRTAVVIEEAQAPALATMIVEACGLTDREREVTELVLRGVKTSEIAATLVVSEYTVQDHLKSIFTKTGVRSRRQLAAMLSDRYYRPARESGAQASPYGWFIPQQT